MLHVWNPTKLGHFLEAGYKLCRVKRVIRGPKGVPYAVTHDGRTVRYPDPDIKVGGPGNRGDLRGEFSTWFA